MRRPSVAAAGFALIDGQAADPDGIVFVDTHPDRGGRFLLACVEPGEYSARGLELASLALRAIRHGFAAHPGPATDALLAAFAVANHALLAENRDLATGQGERRICVGATAVVIQGREIFIAQAAPSQAILIQDQRVYAFPDIASWRGDYSPDAIVPEGLPLGLADDPATQIFRSEAASGDIIALCSTTVGYQLSREDGEFQALLGASLLTDDLEGSVDRLERLMVRQGIATSFAVVASVVRPGAAQSMLMPRLRTQRSAEAGAVIAAVENTMRTPRGVVARDVGIAVAERLARSTPRVTSDDIARRQVLAAPGAQSVRRYRDSGGIPVELRANLPRGPVVHVPARVLAVSMALLMAVGGAGATVGFQRDREARAHAALAEVDRSLQDAAANPLVATSMVTQAEQALEEARTSGADASLVSTYARSLSAVRDSAWSVRRLQNVQMLGALPAIASEAPVQLALSGDTLYVAAGDLYELDSEEGRLVLLLAQGTDINGERVGTLRSVSIDGGAVITTDGKATFVRDGKGVWQRQTLAIDDVVGGISETLPIISWGDATYSVSWEGDVVRFFETSAGSQAETWAASSLNPDLLDATDFVIDGKIHLLLRDGRILTFSRGELTNTTSLFVTPRLSAPTSLAQAPLATQRYLVDGNGVIGDNQGRFIQVDESGNAIQFLTPEDESVRNALANVSEVAIDELSGVVFWISDGVLWQARLPPS